MTRRARRRPITALPVEPQVVTLRAGPIVFGGACLSHLEDGRVVFVSFAEADSDARDRTLGVKVGADQSVAAHRLCTPDDVVAFLQALVRLLAD